MGEGPGARCRETPTRMVQGGWGGGGGKEGRSEGSRQLRGCMPKHMGCSCFSPQGAMLLTLVLRPLRGKLS